MPTLEKAAEVLEHFRSSVSSYVTWWTRMNMSMTQHANSSDEILRAYCELRKTKIIEKWEKLGAIFESYSDKVKFAIRQDLRATDFVVTARCTVYKTNIPIYFPKSTRNR